MTEVLSSITQEKEILRKEADFFNGKSRRDYVGVLTYSPVETVTTLYPQIITGMFHLYNYLEGVYIDPSSQEGFLERYLRTKYYAGDLISDEEVNKLRENIREGKYSHQLEAYLRQRRETVPMVTTQSTTTEYENYRDIRDDKDALRNKRACVGRIIGLQANLETFFGEVDYQKALLAEIVLGTPFLDSVVTNNKQNEESIHRHKTYLDEAIAFIKLFNPQDRFGSFEEITKNFPIPWVQETRTRDLLDLDRPYIQSLYDLSASMLDG